ncbi:MAG: S8 family peptidase [Alkalinema sp. CAN_BIN05]|nr:S8 family peptidase [Alkalinema sp. CAN_BIN05]
MKRWILLFCCLGALGWATAQFSGTLTQGTFDSIIIDFREEIGDSQIQEAMGEASKLLDLTPRLNSEFSEGDHVFVVPGNLELFQKLKKSGLDRYTESLEPNYIYNIPEASQIHLPISVEKAKKIDQFINASKKNYPNDPLFPKQWNLHQINIGEAWTVNKGKGSIVAVIGTGISRVSDLEKTDFVGGYDFINDNSDATDDQGHGTHIAGTIAQSTNNGFGAAGVAPEASLMPVKVLSTGGNGTVADIAEGIRYAADRNASVIALTMVGNGNSSFLQKAIEYAHRKGAVVIAPAGNSSRTAVDYPARYRYVLGVSALDSNGEKAPYSNAGAGVDISAPGGWIVGEDPTGGILQNTLDRKMKLSIFAPYQGTSMAVPHVAGVAALLHTLGITDPDEIGTLLTRSALVHKRDGRNEFGAGALDAAAALKLAQQPQRPSPNYFDWARDRGYIDPRFWIDEQEIAATSKVMILGLAIGLAMTLGRMRRSIGFWLGVGSCGLFLLRGIYLIDASQIPFRILGSTVSELGSLFQGDGDLNPITASFALPLVLGLISLRAPRFKEFAIGLSIGMTASLAVYTVTDTSFHWPNNVGVVKFFLAFNSLLCWGWARYLALPWTDFLAGMVEPWQPKTWRRLLRGTGLSKPRLSIPPRRVATSKRRQPRK